MAANIDHELARRIERLVGTAVVSYARVTGGYTPATRLRCRTRTATFFAKVGATPHTSRFLRREIHIYNAVSGAFMPRLVASEDHDSAPVPILEDLSAAAWPLPWDERRIELVLARIDDMHHTRVRLARDPHVHGAPISNWQTVAASPHAFLALGVADACWLENGLPILMGHEARCRTDGDNLTQWDLRSDNMCITERGAVFVDWNFARLSNPSSTWAFWLPSLAYEGGPDPERILADAPDVAACGAGFFAARAGLPGIAEMPRVRLVQRQHVEMALGWAARARGLPPPSA
jgi:hypothetical protein